MKRSQNQLLYEKLRNEFPFFEYQSYHFWEDDVHFHLNFCFNLAGKFTFKPEIRIPKRDFLSSANNTEALNWLAFHIGMVELVSYWKLACPPQVLIRPFSLDSNQLDWWKKLYYNGLGEFFYVNGITANIADFMQISCDSNTFGKPWEGKPNPSLTLIPIGGGKDSAVTLDLISKGGFPTLPFIVNPRKAILDTLHIAGFKEEEAVIVHRSLDPLMLRLNAEGFLNGHTPFSALLAFSTAFTALLANAGLIALSNESSANEPTVIGQNINHQYSKSLEFEDDFQDYLNHYLLKNSTYFSFLRPLGELQIAAIFSRLEAYHPIFRSCNVGSKTDSWCNNCSKCLFTFLMLQTFLPHDKVIRIFGENLLEKPGLQGVMGELLGKAEAKPFECVGTVDEVELASQIIAQQFGPKKPLLLSTIDDAISKNPENDLKSALHQWDENRIPNEKLTKLLRDALDD